MIIIGIDPGYDRLGFAVIKKEPRQKEELLTSGCLSSDKNTDFAQRLLCLGIELEKIFITYNPDLLVIENLFITKNQKTAMKVAEVRGLILYLAAKNNTAVKQMTPPEIKLAVAGYGNADKTQVTNMAKLLIKIPTKPKFDDEFDAIVIALAGLPYLKQ
ncbi:MAG: crossover junction endodeoxyribonuclease RuvC [Patescibacteria group bacterium]|nr:crossover junction endodeoxyribonuclease RuvC [Patescibacteria group bacterium]